MNTKSGKAKGRRLQNWVRDRLYDTFKFTEEDIRVAIMGESGEDIKLISSSAKAKFPYSIEIKNKEAHNVWADYAQASANAPESREPILIIKRNKHKPLAVIDATVLIEQLYWANDGAASKE